MKPLFSTDLLESCSTLIILITPAVVENPSLKDLLWLNSIISSGTAPSFQPEGQTPSIHTSALTHPQPPIHPHPSPPTPIQTNHSTPNPWPLRSQNLRKVTIGHHVGPSKVAAEGPSLHHLQDLHVSGEVGRNVMGRIGCPGTDGWIC